jgi:hypothetical protein
LNNQSVLTPLCKFINSNYRVNADRLCFYSTIHDNDIGKILLNLKTISSATLISSLWQHFMRVEKRVVLCNSPQTNTIFL